MTASQGAPAPEPAASSADLAAQSTSGFADATVANDDFRLLADNIPTLAWMANGDGYIFWYNRRWYEYTGTTPEQMQGWGWQSVHDPQALPGVLERWRACIADGEPFEMTFPLRGADGVFRPFLTRIVPARNQDGRVMRWFGTNTDIAAQRDAEQALRELNATLERRVAETLAERRLLADIVEGTDAFVQVADLDYRWLAVNRAAADEFERIFGVRPRVGASMLDLLADQPEHQEAVRAVWGRALAGEAFTAVGEFGHPGRDRRHYEMKYNVLRGSDGARIGAYQFVYDVTERVREQARLAQAEEQLRQSQKMEAVGQLTGGLAHDFNNLLTAITGSLELIQERVAQGRVGELERFVLAARGAARRAAGLTHRLLAFSRRQTLDPKPVDVNRLVADMEELVRRTVGPGVAVEVVAAVGLWTTLVDPGQLENALLNLCINARDAMAGGGRLTIETANRWLDDRTAGARDLAAGQYVSLCVSDTGSGMPQDVVARAFDPFFTTKPLGVGTGLGLSMVHGFARQSGGQARIYSEPGQGTVVCLYLPRHHGGEAEGGGAADARADEKLRPGESGETVLVVDDEPAVRMLVAEVLGERGYAVIEAGDGPAGLRVLRSDARIDLLVSDVGLPGGLNGRQLADAARERRPGLKVLFITGYAENAAVRNGQLEPGMHVLTKPFAMDAFAARVRAIVEGS